MASRDLSACIIRRYEEMIGLNKGTIVSIDETSPASSYTFQKQTPTRPQ